MVIPCARVHRQKRQGSPAATDTVLVISGYEGFVVKVFELKIPQAVSMNVLDGVCFHEPELWCL